MRQQFNQWIAAAQNTICTALEKADGKANFVTDKWERADGGGGLTRIIQNGAVFEKGGVNTSAVHGLLTPAIQQQLKVQGPSFFACGISLVLHPYSPMVPTVHANFRYFELYDDNGAVVDSWFGGGADLTPYYLFEEDVVAFHTAFKNSCDKFNAAWYADFKTQCDNYFVNHHRNGERRGVGGIFYDYVRPGAGIAAETLFAFAQSNANALLQAYLPIIERRKNMPYTDAQQHWQLIRRGRYVEFNLVHDRGTLFGLKSNGRTESILMSLPANVRFEYNYQPVAGSDEAKLQQVLMHPRQWV